MALPSSGALSLNDIQTEFGGSNPISLSEYYAGGGRVPAGMSGTYGAVPSSGTISIRDFYGTTQVTISLTDQTIYTSNVPTVYLYYTLTSGGQAQYSLVSGGGSPTNLEQWCTPTSQATNYEAKVTVTSGSLNGGTTGSWVDLATTSSWYIQNSTSRSTVSCTFTVEIRRKGTTVVVDTATIQLSASAF